MAWRVALAWRRHGMKAWRNGVAAWRQKMAERDNSRKAGGV